jgi:hypothetical protein
MCVRLLEVLNPKSPHHAIYSRRLQTDRSEDFAFD